MTTEDTIFLCVLPLWVIFSALVVWVAGGVLVWFGNALRARSRLSKR